MHSFSDSINKVSKSPYGKLANSFSIDFVKFRTELSFRLSGQRRTCTTHAMKLLFGSIEP